MEPRDGAWQGGAAGGAGDGGRPTREPAEAAEPADAAESAEPEPKPAGAEPAGTTEPAEADEAAHRTPTPALIRRRVEPPVWTFGELWLRRYRSADHATVLALHREGLAQVGLRPGDGVYYDHDFFRMEDIYLRNDGEFLVGEVDGRIVAMGGLRRADLVPAGRDRAIGGYVLGGPALDAVEMVRLRVHPDVQRRGYGAAVIEALERRAVEYGYRVLRADTTALQEPALRLYRRFGWTEVRREQIGGIVNIYLEKPLH